MATEETDGLPESTRPASRPWSERFRVRLDATLAPWPVRVPLDVEVTEEVAVDGYRRSRIVFDTEADMSVPAYLLVPDGPGAPGFGRAGRPRSRPGQVPGLRHRRPRGRPGQRLRRRTGPARARGPGPGPPLLRRAGRLEPRRPLRLRHQPGPPGHGRMEPADPEPLGPGAGPRRARGPPAGRSRPGSAWPASPTGGPWRCSWPPPTVGWRPPW